jgi:hypothetical protein
MKVLGDTPGKSLNLNSLVVDILDFKNLIHLYKSVLNTEQVSTISDFADGISSLVPEILQVCMFAAI